MLGGLILLILLLSLVVAGVVAFFMSLICFGYKGSIAEKFIGLLISFFLGPFYWIYYAANGSYCYI